MPQGKLVILYLRISDACIVFPVRLEIHRSTIRRSHRVSNHFAPFLLPTIRQFFPIIFTFRFSLYPRYTINSFIPLITSVLTSFSIYP